MMKEEMYPEIWDRDPVCCFCLLSRICSASCECAW